MPECARSLALSSPLIVWLESTRRFHWANWNYRRALRQNFKVIAPPLRHSDPFVPMRAAMIHGTYLVAIRVRQRTLDRIRAPLAAFVQ